MITVAVIPVKSFNQGKGRLSPTLRPEQRRSLGIGFAEHTADTVIEAGMIPLIVAGDSDVADWALENGLPAIGDPGTGLDAAAQAGVDWAQASGTRWLVLHADLPLLTSGDLALLKMGDDKEVIAPSADGGTSAISTLRPIEFAYGPASFHVHLSRMTNPVVVATLGLLHDVDSEFDLRSASSHPDGIWLRDLLSWHVNDADV